MKVTSIEKQEINIFIMTESDGKIKICYVNIDDSMQSDIWKHATSIDISWLMTMN